MARPPVSTALKSTPESRKTKTELISNFGHLAANGRWQGHRWNRDVPASQTVPVVSLLDVGIAVTEVGRGGRTNRPGSDFVSNAAICGALRGGGWSGELVMSRHVEQWQRYRCWQPDRGGCGRQRRWSACSSLAETTLAAYHIYRLCH